MKRGLQIMQGMLAKLRWSLKRDGISTTLIKALKYPFRRRRGDAWREILRDNLSIEQRFSTIYRNRLWGSDKTPSGAGSSIDYTANLRAKLPSLVAKYEIRTIFDAPCGDLNWMKLLLPVLNANYFGGDIVKELIDGHRRVHASPTARFLHINLIEDEFPNADLMICRDCLFHLSYSHIKRVLENYVNADIAYLLTTSHITAQPNTDITTGDFRLLNLIEKPYYFDSCPLERIDDWIEPSAARQLGLWSRSQVIRSLEKMNQAT